MPKPLPYQDEFLKYLHEDGPVTINDGLDFAAYRGFYSSRVPVKRHLDALVELGFATVTETTPFMYAITERGTAHADVVAAQDRDDADDPPIATSAPENDLDDDLNEALMEHLTHVDNAFCAAEIAMRNAFQEVLGEYESAFRKAERMRIEHDAAIKERDAQANTADIDRLTRERDTAIDAWKREREIGANSAATIDKLHTTVRVSQKEIDTIRARFTHHPDTLALKRVERERDDAIARADAAEATLNSMRKMLEVAA